MTKSRHPSGRPKRENVVKGFSVFRNPVVGSLLPRLQVPETKDAIGFHRLQQRGAEEIFNRKAK